MDTFDFVVVGAGSAGSALAARLSEDGRHTVLLLEAGGTGRHPWIHVPIGYGKTFYDGRFNWKFEAEADPGLVGRRMYWPRGKVLGGSSAINAMVYVRGHPADYEEWGEAATGWRWVDVEPVFRRMETWRGPPDVQRGTAGPLSVTDVSSAMHPLTHAYIRAAREAGFEFTPDYNGAQMKGAAFYQITTDRGVRASAASAYLRPARRRRNLTVRTGALAQRILFEGRTATGVEYRQMGRRRRARARNEVILCCGAIQSPQLLQVSGVGPGSLLARMGIPIVHALREVGRNLADHLSLDLMFTSVVPSLNQDLRSFWGKARAALRYAIARDGPLSMSLNQAGGFVSPRGQPGAPEMQIYFSPLSYSRAPKNTRPLMRPDPFPAYRLGYNPCKPTSRGYLEIRSPHVRDAPAMHPNYLSTEADCRAMIDGVHLMRQIAAMPALRDVTGNEVVPGSVATTEDALLDHARRDGWTVFHQCGTCRMGTDPDTSVVDPRLRVHGIDGLRVADASIFPTIPSGNTNAPAIMVGERASDLIREDWAKKALA
ncbi:MAG: GMC family oxidoreductase N-terminal domain-containing protein [Pseudomonadota bacterium]